MRYILIILVFLSVGANAQMVIKAHANYRPFAAPVSANLLLDDYPNAAAAYSLRKLDKDYTGAAIRVRKDTTGQPEQDIFFVGNELDTASLKSFLNARSGFVTTWYDQVGTKNFTQATQANQPRIANLGVIDRASGKPIVRFDGSNDVLGLSSKITFTNQTIFSVNNLRSTITTASAQTLYWHDRVDDPTKIDFVYFGDATGQLTNERISWLTNIFNIKGVAETSTNIPSGNYIWTFLFDQAPAGETNVTRNIYQNGTNLTLTTTQFGGNFTDSYYPSGITRIGAANSTGGDCLQGAFFEFIVYDNNQSSNRTGIENNINDYYNLYWNGDFTGILDTYPNSAAAYSLRNLSSTYTGPLIRVRKDTTGQPEMDIYGDYFGNLDTVGLKQFLSTRSGFISVWYDQSGNSGRNASQSTQANQPRIALNGVIDRQGTRPTVLFDGSNDGIATSTNITYTNNDQLIAIVNTPSETITSATSFNVLLSGGQPSSPIDETLICYGSVTGNLTNERLSFIALLPDTANPVNNNVWGYGQTTNNISGNNLQIFQWTSSVNIHQNSISQTLSTCITNPNISLSFNSNRKPTKFRAIGYRQSNNSGFFNGKIQEVVIYDSNQSSNRTGIESNINTYYGIY